MSHYLLPLCLYAVALYIEMLLLLISNATFFILCFSKFIISCSTYMHSDMLNSKCIVVYCTQWHWWQNWPAVERDRQTFWRYWRWSTAAILSSERSCIARWCWSVRRWQQGELFWAHDVECQIIRVNFIAGFSLSGFLCQNHCFVKLFFNDIAHVMLVNKV